MQTEKCNRRLLLFSYSILLSGMKKDITFTLEGTHNWGVTIHWTGLLDWHTELDYWPEIFSFSRQVCVFIYCKPTINKYLATMDDYNPDYNNNNSCLLQCFQHFGNV